MRPRHVLHFSDRADIGRFEPRVPVVDPGVPPLVWAIDETHAPLYWFPRECPRACVWARDEVEQARLREVFSCASPRLHIVEEAWRARLARAVIHEYRFTVAGFEPWAQAHGHWVSETVQEPGRVRMLDALIDRQRAAGIELRFVTDLWSARDLIATCELPFSVVRMRNASPRH